MNAWYTAHIVDIQQFFIFIILALSIQVVLRAGVASFAGIAFYGAGGYVAGNLALDGMSMLPILLVVMIASAIIGYLVAIPLAKLQGLYLGMVTFALIQITVVAATNGGSYTGGAIGLYGIPLLTDTWSLAVVALAVIIAIALLQRSSLGRGFASMRVDVNLTRALGFEVAHMRAYLFAVSAALGGLAGALNVLTFTVLSPESFGFSLLVMALIMAVIGGVSSWRGAILGALIVTWFPSIFTFLDGAVREIVYGTIVVLVMTYEPDGIMGLIGRFRRKLRRRNSQDLNANVQGAASANSKDLQEGVLP